MSETPTAQPSIEELERALHAAAQASTEIANAEVFYRHLAVHMARAATSDFKRAGRVDEVDGAGAIHAFLRHEEDVGRLRKGDIVAKGAGFRVQANVRSCPFESACHGNLQALGEVPQCMRAITLIEAVTAKVLDRPPMTYDLAPGLVDRSSDSCEIKLRPAGAPDIVDEPVPART